MPIPTLIHLAMMALMVLFCIAAAVVAWNRTGVWIPKHRLLGLLGACSGLIAASVMVYEKVERGYPHFKSPHAIVGLCVVILLICVPLLGFLSTKGFNLLRMPHRVLARILVILGLVGLLTGLLRYLQLTKPHPAPAPAAPATGSGTNAVPAVPPGRP